MKVGDLVRYWLIDGLGIITKIQHQMDTEAFFVMFSTHNEYDGWYGDLELEVV